MELPLSFVLHENKAMRFDSAYFSKTALAAEAVLKQHYWDTLGHVTTSVESFGAYALTNFFDYVEEGVPFLRCVNIKNGIADFNNILFIDKEAHDLLYKSQIHPNMVLLTMSGSVGNSAVALPDWNYPINSNQDIAKISLQNNYSPYYLSAFLNGYYGNTQMQRLPVGSVQQHVFLWMIEQLVVPINSRQFQLEIEGVMRNAYETVQRSQAYYTRAERLLLAELGLLEWQPPQTQSYERSASTAFAAGRLDAEYFSPRVEQLLARLGRDALTVADVAPPRFESFVPADSLNAMFDYIEIGDLKRDGTTDSQHLPRSEAPSRATWYVQQGDVITSTVRPVRRLSALIQANQTGFVCSSGFLVLNPSHVSTELLLLYLRLPLVCELMDLHTTASMYPAISPTDLLALPFPSVDPNVEQQIIQAVQAAHQTKLAAHALLARATRAVEIAIEENEAAALAFLSMD